MIKIPRCLSGIPTILFFYFNLCDFFFLVMLQQAVIFGKILESGHTVKKILQVILLKRLEVISSWIAKNTDSMFRNPFFNFFLINFHGNLMTNEKSFYRKSWSSLLQKYRRHFLGYKMVKYYNYFRIFAATFYTMRLL